MPESSLLKATTNLAAENLPVSVAVIERRIYPIRGRKNLKPGGASQLDRFPKTCMFQLTQAEFVLKQPGRTDEHCHPRPPYGKAGSGSEGSTARSLPPQTRTAPIGGEPYHNARGTSAGLNVNPIVAR